MTHQQHFNSSLKITCGYASLLHATRLPKGVALHRLYIHGYDLSQGTTQLDLCLAATHLGIYLEPLPYTMLPMYIEAEGHYLVTFLHPSGILHTVLVHTEDLSYSVFDPEHSRWINYVNTDLPPAYTTNVLYTSRVHFCAKEQTHAS